MKILEAHVPPVSDTAQRRTKRARPAPVELAEWGGIVVLMALAVYFLSQSWRKWPDPIIDSGPQWYAIWRVAQGALPYHDFAWLYGPMSVVANGFLFKCFGPGMMVLATANLLVYTAIATLAYLAFRMAWGRLAAFAALAVFISVFSFSMLNTVGNYNYALPYTHEATHGMLLMLVTAFVMVRWCRKSSRAGAFLLGLCGGIAAVLKPEFMLSAGVLGLAALVVRYRQGRAVRWQEYGMLLAGVVLPTLLFTAWFARGESWTSALVDSSQAWWLVLVSHHGPTVLDESSYMGFDHGWRNAGWEAEATLGIILRIGAIWAAGWLVNRPWSRWLRFSAAAGALALAFMIDGGGGFEVGPCLPGLVAIALVLVLLRLRREGRRTGSCEARYLMALALVLLGATMLARMALRARINHFGFIQAAFAGMVVTAIIVAEVPQWTGPGKWGRRTALLGITAMLAMGCGAIVAESRRNLADQTQAVGSGADRFYALGQRLSERGALVNWCVTRLRSASPAATVLVLPEGVMINYLSRHARPMPEFQSDEEDYIRQLGRTRPDYVVLLWGDEREGAFRQFGDPGQAGEKIVRWLRTKYTVEASHSGSLQWAFILRRNPA